MKPTGIFKLYPVATSARSRHVPQFPLDSYRDFHAVTTNPGQGNSQDSSCNSSGGDGGLRDAQKRGKGLNERVLRGGSERGGLDPLTNDGGRDRGLSEPDERQEGKHGHPDGKGHRGLALLGTEVRCVDCGVRPRSTFRAARLYRHVSDGCLLEVSLLPAATMCSLSLESAKFL